MLDLKPIKERESKATKGPWILGGPFPQVSVCVCVDEGCTYPADQAAPPIFEPIAIFGESTDSSKSYCPDADFVAESRQDIPNLIAEVEQLRTKLRRLEIGYGRLTK